MVVLARVSCCKIDVMFFTGSSSDCFGFASSSSGRQLDWNRGAAGVFFFFGLAAALWRHCIPFEVFI